jgi:integrase
MGKLTPTKVRALHEPGRYSDGDGLFLEVSPSGTKRWLLRIQSQGRRRDIGLGALKSAGLGDAREAAAVIRKKVAQGIDPVAERKQERVTIPTFRVAAGRVHAEHKAGWRNGKHQAQWLKTLEIYAFPSVGDRLVSEIEGPAIRDLLATIWLSKPETARRVRQRIGAVLDWAYAKGFRQSEAPMRSVSKGLPRQPRKDGHFAALPYERVPEFLAFLRQKESAGRLAVEAVILTAARSGEIRFATWPEFDLERRLWSIPAKRMKMGRLHIVPLSGPMLDLLKRAETLRKPNTSLVFPGQKRRAALSDMTLLKVVRDAGLAVTVHGFRSAFRDWVAERTDFASEVAEAALAHAIPNKVEAAYRRTDFLERRTLLMEEWGRFCVDSRKAARESPE